MLLLKLEMPDDRVVERFNVKFENSFGSYFSPIFSKRLRSSSNIDFFVKNDFKMSDGFTSFTSSSKNLCRLENVADAGDGDGDGDSLTDGCLPVAVAVHISNIPSMVLMRSSNDGLEPSSKSLGLELNDGPTSGLSGGCSIGCTGFCSKVAVSTGLIFGSVGGAGGGFGNLLSGAEGGVGVGGGGGIGCCCCGCCGGCGTLGVVDEGSDDVDDDDADDEDDADVGW